MEMTDKQFDAYVLAQLRRLENVQKILLSQGIKNEELDELISDLQDQLKRP